MCSLPGMTPPPYTSSPLDDMLCIAQMTEEDHLMYVVMIGTCDLLRVCAFAGRDRGGAGDRGDRGDEEDVVSPLFLFVICTALFAIYSIHVPA